MVYATSVFPDQYVPTVFDHYQTRVTVRIKFEHNQLPNIRTSVKNTFQFFSDQVDHQKHLWTRLTTKPAPDRWSLLVFGTRRVRWGGGKQNPHQIENIQIQVQLSDLCQNLLNSNIKHFQGEYDRLRPLSYPDTVRKRSRVKRGTKS